MAEEKEVWTRPLIEIARQITTPIAAKVAYVIGLIFLGRAIISSAIGDNWKGCLVLIDMALLSLLVISTILMAIKYPKNLTFDKDAHIAVDVDSKHTTDAAVGLKEFASDLVDPVRLEEMADRIKKLELTATATNGSENGQ